MKCNQVKSNDALLNILDILIMIVKKKINIFLSCMLVALHHMNDLAD